MNSGEMPIEPGASWFSSKCVEAQQFLIVVKVQHCFDAGYENGTNFWQTRNVTAFKNE